MLRIAICDSSTVCCSKLEEDLENISKLSGEKFGYGTYRLWKAVNSASIEIVYVKDERKGEGYEEALLKTMLESIWTETEIHPQVLYWKREILL